MFSAIIDNTALVYLTSLHHGKTSFLDNLRNLFSAIYIPMEVKNEYARGAITQPDRNWLLDRLKPHGGFFRLCTAYDSFAMVLVDGFKGMDRGEAESYAQLKRISANIIVSDDKRFVKALETLDPTIRVYSTLHIICWLDLLSLGIKWAEIIPKIHDVRKFESADLRKAYNDMLKILGLNLSKKEISKKCSLKKLFDE